MVPALSKDFLDNQANYRVSIHFETRTWHDNKIKEKLFAYLWSYKSPIWVTIAGNDNVYKTIWRNENKEYNQRYICSFLTIWNLKSAITYNCGQVVLSNTSVYFAINKPILLLSYFFTYHALYFPFIFMGMFSVSLSF